MFKIKSEPLGPKRINRFILYKTTLIKVSFIDVQGGYKETLPTSALLAPVLFNQLR